LRSTPKPSEPASSWLKGLRIAKLEAGKVTIFVPPHKTDGPDEAAGEGIAMDSAGNLFTAETTVRGVTKYAHL
jgi:hypothetical protein